MQETLQCLGEICIQNCFWEEPLIKTSPWFAPKRKTNSLSWHKFHGPWLKPQSSLRGVQREFSPSVRLWVPPLSWGSTGEANPAWNHLCLQIWGLSKKSPQLNKNFSPLGFQNLKICFLFHPTKGKNLLFFTPWRSRLGLMSRQGAMKFGQIHNAKNTRKFWSAMDLMIIRGCCWNMDLLPWTTLTAVFMSQQVGFMDCLSIERHKNWELSV